MASQRTRRIGPRIAAAALAAVLAGASAGLLGLCGPFTDVAADAFCPFVLEIFYLGITTGTTATTYDPAANVSRLQMAAFLSRTVDGVLRRGSRRAAMQRFAFPQTPDAIALTTVALNSQGVICDGADVWVAGISASGVSRVRASDGRLLETWTGADGANGLRAGAGRIVVSGNNSPGKLFSIDPSQPAGAVTTVATNLGNGPAQVAFDGARFFTANFADSSVSIVTPGASLPWTVTTVTTGFTIPVGALFDGANVWITDKSGKLFQLSSSGAILMTVTIPVNGLFPAFDGANIWVPLQTSNAVAVVRASNGTILQMLTGNNLSNPLAAAFDGERILLTSHNNDSVALWKAADLTALGSVSTGTGTGPYAVASDGLNFWITLNTISKLARF